MADFQAVIPVFDPIALKYIPVQIVLDKVQMNFSETARAAAVFLTMAQEKINTPIVAIEVRQDKKRGVYIKYLAEKPNKHNVRRKTFEENWEEIRNTVYEITLNNTSATEKVFEEVGQ